MNAPTPLKTALTPEQAKQRRDAQLTQARAEGRDQGRKEWSSYITDAAQAAVRAVVDPLRAAHAEVLTHARSSAWWRGAFIGLVLGIAAGAIISSLALGGAFQQAGQYGREMVVTGAISQAANPPHRCVSGEHLDDGRVCP